MGMSQNDPISGLQKRGVCLFEAFVEGVYTLT